MINIIHNRQQVETILESTDREIGKMWHIHTIRLNFEEEGNSDTQYNTATLMTQCCTRYTSCKRGIQNYPIPIKCLQWSNQQETG